MRRKPMSKLRCDLASLGECSGSERLELVAVLCVARERKNFGAEAQEPDAVFVVPPEHLDDIAGVG